VNATDPSGSGQWTNKSYQFSTEHALSSWTNRIKIIIDHTNIDDDLVNYPMLLDLEDNIELATNSQDDFDDILFTNDSVNWFTGFASEKLNHEIESYNSDYGNLTAWVNIPFVSSTVDTIIYMYFGNPSCGNMENIEDVWDSNYVMIHHLNETSGTHYDSTSYDNDGTNTGSNQDVVGMIDGANSFDGTDDYIRVPDDTTIQFDEGSFTVEVWMYPNTGTDNVRIANNRGTGSGGTVKGWQLKIRQSTGQWKLKDSAIDDDTGNYKNYESTNTYSYNNWYHVCMVYDADNELRFYVNGSLDGTVSVGSYGNITNNLPTSIGAAVAHNGVEGTYSQLFDGSIDEIRLSNIVRNASWLKACYLNQNDPSSFYILPMNLSPVISNPSPSNNSVNVAKSLTQLSVEITDPDSDLFNWSIETNPVIGYNSGILDNNGSKTCSISGLDYNITYTWYVNATDTGSDGWVNKTYSFTTESPPASWWNTNWLYRMSIVIDHDKVSENLTNFPVLIDITEANLSTKAQSDGDDIVFTDYNSIQLNHEIEYYDNGSGHLIAWVNVTNLSATVDTVLYMYYGNPSRASMENISGTWRSEFVMVHHLDETSGTHYDSTSYGNNGTAQSSVDQNVTGKIDGADEFDDTANAFIDVGVDSSMDIYGPNNDFSIMLWVKRNNITNMEGFFSSGSSGPNGIYFGTKYLDENDLKFMSPDNTVDVISNVNCINDYNWHLVGVTSDRDSNMNLWVDGASVASQSIAGTAGENWNRVDDTYKIGTDRSEGNPMDGILDEVWVYDGLLSTGWIATCYENQNDPSAFYSTSAEEENLVPEEYLISLSNNWNLISLPFNESVDKSDIIVSYNGSDYTWQQAVDNTTVLDFIYGWNASSQSYYSAESLEPGLGYWVWAYADCGIMFSSSVGEDDYITDLELSWNMIGLPSNTSLWKENLVISYNGTDYSWYNATTNDNEEGEPLILGFIYNWDRIIQNYMLSDDFDPGYGYWMYAYYDCILRRS
jgi:hypothetical protein